MNFSKIDLENITYQGSFADIYKVKNNKIIIKLIKINQYKYLDNLTEILILNNFKSINIIKSFGLILIDNKLGFILSLANCTLEDYKFNSFIEKEIAIFQLIEGIKFLHSNRWLHLDLKPSNILIKNNKFLISDFSLSVKTNNLSIITENHVISPIYRPYENLKGSLFYSDKSDLWSLGLIIYGILNNRFIEDEIINISINNKFNIEMSIILHIEKLIAWGLWLHIKECTLWDNYKYLLDINIYNRISLVNIINYNYVQEEIENLFKIIIIKYPEMNSINGYNFCKIIISSIYGKIPNNIDNIYLDNLLEILIKCNFILLNL